MFFSEPKIWRRMRYASRENAIEALSLLISANLKAELAYRVEADVPALWVGADNGVWNALSAMAGDYGLVFDPPATPPKPLKGTWIPGNRFDTPAVDALIDQHGMSIRADGAEARKADKSATYPVNLPDATGVVGLSALTGDVELTAPNLSNFVWDVGGSGANAPAGVLGVRQTVMNFWTPPLAHYLSNGGRPTVLLDGSDGSLSRTLRRVPDVARALESGHTVDLSLTKAGQRGFAPLRYTGDDETTWAKWCFVFRNTGFDTEHLAQAFEEGIETLPELGRWLASDKRRVVSLHALKRMADADNGTIGTWLSGSFDAVQHITRGNHLLVECPNTDQPHRLFAVRSLLAVAMESGARLFSFGVRWPEQDDPALAWVDTMAVGRRWTSTVFTRCTPEMAHDAAKRHQDPKLGEVLRTLPDGKAIVIEGEQKWTISNS